MDNFSKYLLHLQNFKMNVKLTLTSPALPAILTVLPRLYIDLAGALSSADVLCCSLVLQGSSEERSAAEAGDGPVVNMSSSSLSTYLEGERSNINVLINITSKNTAAQLLWDYE